MNSSIRNLFVLFVVLFGVLVAFTSRWTVFEDKGLRTDALNNRDVIRASRVPRGKILAADGTVLARSKSVKSRDTGNRYYQRVYPQGSLYAATVGFSDQTLGQQAGLERSQNDFLSGKAVKLATAVNKLIQGDQRGDDVRTTLEPSVMKAAVQGLNGRAGSVVALEPKTGKVLAMVTVPSYDPDDLIAGGDAAKSEAYRKTLKNGALLSRATQFPYVPGSTFKVVTTAAALDSGKYTPDTLVNGANNQTFSSVPLGNFGGEDPGMVTVRQALVQSVNGAFGNIAVDLGGRALQTAMEKFGFDSRPPLDLPEDQVRRSGILRKDKLIKAYSKYVDLARTGIGQDKLGVTPLQMAMVVSAVANDGKLMKPHLVDRVTDADGRVQEQVEPETYKQAMKASTAASLRSMMANVVDEGTGAQANLGTGVKVGGKTGTAELGNVTAGINNLWFIGFAPVEDPKVAVAVIVEKSAGQGGQVAAPIAKTVIQSALDAGAGR
ncbi:peptidoglycan D,D-transpeptidase FtsI family protein [Patulibacter minatonensis]|uniref:peptidoglycan D,D-transpeptidase FtsI family protein n=1 Tax=Patulibacter minatonensis TaxID=298163 RepID=UPI00047C64DF|nr:penicillin-binding protein 2 [Patulibacter minatonensis]